MVEPLFSDLQPVKYKYQPGDRLIARVSFDATPSQQVNIRRALKKRCGVDLRILIVNCLKMRLTQISTLGDSRVLVSPVDAQVKGIDAGVANIDCSVTQFSWQDTLLVETPYIDGKLDLCRIKWSLLEWVGRDIEIKIIKTTL